MTARPQPVLPRLERFLKKDGFVVLTHNEGDPSKHGPFEAWAYRGPLDLPTATPVTFGAGTSVPDALEALALSLENARRHVGRDEQPHLDRRRGS